MVPAPVPPPVPLAPPVPRVAVVPPWLTVAAALPVPPVSLLVDPRVDPDVVVPVALPAAWF
jgi:hypothetical protein